LSSGNFEGSSDYERMNLEGSAKLLFDLAAEFAENAKDNLNKKDRVASGALLDSIVPMPLRVMGKTIVADVKVLDYYKYIDKGAKYTTKMPPVAEIRKWILKEGIKERNNKYKAISKRESKRKTLSESSKVDQMAFGIAMSIKKKGLKKTNFWTDAMKDLNKTIDERLGKTLAIDIINTLKDGFST
jgi:hypothetical protein